MVTGTETGKLLLSLPARWLKIVEAILRSHAGQRTAVRLTGLFICTFVCGAGYGAAMGTFTMQDWQRWPQIAYSAAKVPLLLLGAFSLSLPSFYVFNLLMGLSQDFKLALRGLAATQSGLAIVLVSLSPFTLFWYHSFANYQAALAFNGFMFAVASISAQVLLRRHYGPLIRQNPRHRIMLGFWLVIYMLVAIQLAWLMRPFIGDPKRPPEFFRHDPFNNNAYVMVIKTVWRFLTEK
jgi:hypothetical protein